MTELAPSITMESLLEEKSVPKFLTDLKIVEAAFTESNPSTRLSIAQTVLGIAKECVVHQKAFNKKRENEGYPSPPNDPKARASLAALEKMHPQLQEGDEKETLRIGIYDFCESIISDDKSTQTSMIHTRDYSLNFLKNLKIGYNKDLQNKIEEILSQNEPIDVFQENVETLGKMIEEKPVNQSRYLFRDLYMQIKETPQEEVDTELQFRQAYAFWLLSSHIPDKTNEDSRFRLDTRRVGIELFEDAKNGIIVNPALKQLAHKVLDLDS